MDKRLKKLAWLSATGLVATGLAMHAMAQDMEPIRIGVPTPLSGPFSVLGEQVKTAIEFAADEINAKGGIDGRQVDVRFADSEAKPDAARKQAEQLALSGYNLLIGPISSGVSLALAPMLERWDALYVISSPKSTKLTGDACEARMFRVAQNDAFDLAAVKGWMESIDEAKWVAMGSDMAWGRDAVEGFEKALGDLGGKTVTDLFPAYGETDFAPYIQQIRDSGADHVFVAVSGGDAINFLRQAHQFGLQKSVTLSGIGYNYDVVIGAVDDNAEGIWGAVNYSPSLDTPENAKFVEAWRAAHDGTDPTDYHGGVYTAISTLFQAIDKADSSKPADVAKALEGGTFDTVFGKLTMRAEDHQMAMPNYFGEVVMEDGKARNVIRYSLTADQAPPVDPACTKGNAWN